MEGRIKCGKWQHFTMKMNENAKYKTPCRIPARDLIDAMPVGVVARCDCERTACREAWQWRRPGVYEDDWVQPGSYKKGYGGKPSITPRRVMPVTFVLSNEDITYLHDRHPGWLFLSVDTEFHDHPCAHASTQVATYNLFHSLPKGSYLDIHGAPAMCDKMNAELKGRQFMATCHVETPDDVIKKATRWGPEFNEDGSVRWLDTDIRDLQLKHRSHLNEADALTSIHTLYYFKPEELPGLLAGTKSGMMYGIMHRFVGDRGTMNNGEQTWERLTRDGVNYIKQTNVKGRKSYYHLDNSHWFENTSWMPHERSSTDEVKDLDPTYQDKQTGLCWDINLAGPDTYAIRVCVATPRQVAADPCYVPKAEVVLEVNSEAFIAKECHVVLPTITGGTTNIAVPPAYQQLFKELRTRMLGASERNPKKYVAHAQMCALRAKGIMAADPSIKDVQVLYDLVYASFWVDCSLDRKYEAFVGVDFRKGLIETIIHGLQAKSLAGGIATMLLTLKHHI
jgi:hypothetical protein